VHTHHLQTQQHHMMHPSTHVHKHPKQVRLKKYLQPSCGTGAAICCLRAAQRTQQLLLCSDYSSC
jgi:hypothetical protein